MDFRKINSALDAFTSIFYNAEANRKVLCTITKHFAIHRMRMKRYIAEDTNTLFISLNYSKFKKLKLPTHSLNILVTGFQLLYKDTLKMKFAIWVFIH